MPVRAVATGFRATATLTGASITAATAVSATLAKTGVGTGMKVAIIPLRAGAKALSGELSRETLGRNCWRGERRAWIEVRGLRSGGDDELGRVVLNAIQAHPGVGSASLNYPLSRVVVAIDDPDTSLRELCRIVDDAEKAERHRHPDQAADQLAQSPGSLPGDGVLLAVRAVTVAATAAGLGLALGGRALRWPRFPLVIEAAVAAVDHQPLLRRLLEDRIGTEATATVLELAMAAAHTVTLSPAALSVDLTIQALKAAECRAGARAWRRHEPQLALHADEPADQPQSLWPRPARSTQPVQRSVARFALIQALSAVLVGAGTRDADMAATATLVATPKASRTTPEAFAAALGQGLADQHAVLPLRPESLRRLDRVDAIVIDPRVLCTDDLRVARIRGCGADELSTAWNRATRFDGEWPAPRLAPSTRCLGQRFGFGSRGTFPPHARPAGLRGGCRGTSHRGGPGFGRCRRPGRVATGVRRHPAPRRRCQRVPRRSPSPCGGRAAPGGPHRRGVVIGW
nr:hypothetical protein [Mycobacterium tuberculosis]